MDPLCPTFQKFPGNTAASLSTTLSEPLEKSIALKHLGLLGPGRLWLAGLITYVNLWEWLGSQGLGIEKGGGS